MAEYPATPELDKMLGVRDESATISEFLDWLEMDGITIARYEQVQGYSAPQLLPTGEGFEKLLERYFGIDGRAVERERREVLRYVREMQS